MGRRRVDGETYLDVAKIDRPSQSFLQVSVHEMIVAQLKHAHLPVFQKVSLLQQVPRLEYVLGLHASHRRSADAALQKSGRG